MRNIVIDSIKTITIQGKEEFAIRTQIDTEEFDRLDLLDAGYKNFQDMSHSDLLQRSYEEHSIFYDEDYSLLLNDDYIITINGTKYQPNEIQELITTNEYLYEQQVSLIEETQDHNASNLQYSLVGRKVIINSEKWYIKEVSNDGFEATVTKISDPLVTQLIDVEELEFIEDEN